MTVTEPSGPDTTIPERGTTPGADADERADTEAGADTHDGADDGAADAATFQPILGSAATGPQSGLEVLHDVVMGVTVELGRTRMPLRDILTVVPGSVIELDRAASAPVDVLVNGTLIARGEVVVIDEEFGIRITEVVGREQTIHGDPAS